MVSMGKMDAPTQAPQRMDAEETGAWVETRHPPKAETVVRVETKHKMRVLYRPLEQEVVVRVEVPALAAEFIWRGTV